MDSIPELQHFRWNAAIRHKFASAVSNHMSDEYRVVQRVRMGGGQQPRVAVFLLRVEHCTDVPGSRSEPLRLDVHV